MCVAEVETIIRIRSGPHPSAFASIARSTAFSRIVTAVSSTSGDLLLDPPARPDRLQQLVGVGELRHPLRVPEVRHLEAPVAREDELLEDPELGRGGDPLLLVLEAVADGDVGEVDALREVPVRHVHLRRSRAARTVNACVSKVAATLPRCPPFR